MNRNYATQFTYAVPFENSIPYLYRYEKQKWIDKFFETGDIKLSSFKNYKKYEDNQLGDPTEGHSMNIVKGDNDKMISTFSMVGHNEYSFCTSTLLDEKLKSVFDRDSVFMITDPLNFMIEIARSLPRVQGVLFGNCLYVNERIISKSVARSIDMEDFKDDNEEDKVNLQKMIEAASPSLTRHRFFLKHTDYQPQAEYRMLWSTDRPVDDGLIVNCPEARQFCDRI